MDPITLLKQIKTESVDDVPVLIAQAQRMGIPALIDQVFPVHGNWSGLSMGWVTAVWLAHILSEANHHLNHCLPWVASRLDVVSTCLSMLLPQVHVQGQAVEGQAVEGQAVEDKQSRSSLVARWSESWTSPMTDWPSFWSDWLMIATGKSSRRSNKGDCCRSMTSIHSRSASTQPPPAVSWMSWKALCSSKATARDPGGNYPSSRSCRPHWIRCPFR